MSDNKNDKKKIALIVIALIVVVCIAVGVGMIFGYHNNQNRNTTNSVDSEKENNRQGDEEKENGDVSQENDKKPNQENKNQVINISLDSAKQLGYIDLYEHVFPGWYHIGYYDFYYHTASSRNVQGMDQGMKIHLTGNFITGNNNYKQYEDDNGNYILPEAVFKEAYADLFGSDNYNFVEPKYNCPGYRRTSDGYVHIYTQCGDTAVPSLFKNVVKVEQNTTTQELYIYENYVFAKALGEVGPNHGELFNIYADYEKSILLSSRLESTTDGADDTEVLSKVSGTLPMNKYIFKKKPQSSKGNGQDYYFYGVERVQ